MFITMFGSISSTFIVLIFGNLNLAYALVLVVMIGWGTYFGLFMQYRLVESFGGRSSITVALLMLYITFSMVANPSISIVIMLRQAAAGVNIWKMGSYC